MSQLATLPAIQREGRILETVEVLGPGKACDFGAGILNPTGVALVPGDAAGGPDHLRRSCTNSDTAMDPEFARLRSALEGNP